MSLLLILEQKNTHLCQLSPLLLSILIQFLNKIDNNKSTSRVNHLIEFFVEKTVGLMSL